MGPRPGYQLLRPPRPVAKVSRRPRGSTGGSGPLGEPQGDLTLPQLPLPQLPARLLGVSDDPSRGPGQEAWGHSAGWGSSSREPPPALSPGRAGVLRGGVGVGGKGAGSLGALTPTPAASCGTACLPERNRVPGPHQGPRGHRNAWDMPALCIRRVAALGPLRTCTGVCVGSHTRPRCCGQCLMITSLPALLPPPAPKKP